MKNILKYSMIFSLFIGFVSCDSTDDDTGYLNDRTSVSYFVPGSSGTLLVEEEAPAVYEVKVGISEPKNFDRAFTYSIDPTSTAVEGVDFTTSSTLVVPANSVVGTITVTGIYAGSVLAGKVAKFNLEDVEDALIGQRKQFSLNIFRSCPVPSDYFVGTYEIQQQSGNAPFGIGFAWGTQTVEVTGSANVRSYNYSYAPAAFDSPYFMDMSLICGNIFVNGTIQPGNGTLGCGSGSIGQSTPPVPGTYDVNDDQEITVRVLDFEPLSGCAATSQYTAVLKFVKQ